MCQTLKQVYINLFYQDQTSFIDSKNNSILRADFQERIRGMLDNFLRESEARNLVLPEQYYQLYHREFGNLPFLLEIIHQLERSSGSSKTFLEPNDGAFEWLSAEYLLHSLEDYLAQKIVPLQICTLIQKIESAMIEVGQLSPENIIYYPSWLGDLWNQCDWCDESWRFETHPHLAAVIETQIQEIAKWLQDHRVVLDEKNT